MHRRPVHRVRVARAWHRITRAPLRALAGYVGKQVLGPVRASVRGIPVFLATDGPDDPYLDRLDEALQLLEHVDPRRLTRLRRDVAGILVAHRGGTEYWPPLRLIVLHPPSLLHDARAITAAALVHEGTHARHFAMGVRTWPDNMSRVEALCVRHQTAFLSALPEDELPQRDQMVNRLGAQLERPWWTAGYNWRRTKRALRELEWPSWLRRWFRAAAGPSKLSSREHR